MRVGDVRKFLPKDDDEQIVIAWWEYGDGEAWPEWLTEKMWNHYCEQIDSGHDWSYEHESICDHFDSLRQYEPMKEERLAIKEQQDKDGDKDE